MEGGATDPTRSTGRTGVSRPVARGHPMTALEIEGDAGPRKDTRAAIESPAGHPDHSHSTCAGAARLPLAMDGIRRPSVLMFEVRRAYLCGMFCPGPRHEPPGVPPSRGPQCSPGDADGMALPACPIRRPADPGCRPVPHGRRLRHGHPRRHLLGSEGAASVARNATGLPAPESLHLAESTGLACNTDTETEHHHV